MKHILLLICFFSFSLLGFAENWDDIVASSEYYHGQGSGTTKDAAESDALSALIESISNNVRSSFKGIGEDVNINGKVTSALKLESCIKTYSELRLSNVILERSRSMTNPE